MEENQSFESNFMKERIKERPINHKKLLRRTVLTVVMALIFGTVASATFLLLQPIISNRLNQEEAPNIVEFPEVSEEVLPEDLLEDKLEKNTPVETSEPIDISALTSEDIQQLMSRLDFNKDNYREIYSSLASYVEEINKSIVTISGVTSNTDWFNGVQEQRDQSAGVLIANNGVELIAITEYRPLSRAESYKITFYNNETVEAYIKGIDHRNGIAAVAVKLSDLPDGFTGEVDIAALGSSATSGIVGSPIVAVGRPMGVNGSVGHGMIAASSGIVSVPDSNYKLLQTNISGAANPNGFIFNYQKQVIGIICGDERSVDPGRVLTAGTVTAMGITELRGHIAKIVNGIDKAYLGITTVDVTEEANRELDVPMGAYVTELVMDSPAVFSGIRRGDVIVQVADNEINNSNDYVTALLQLVPGEETEIKILRQAGEVYRNIEIKITPTAD